MSLRVRLLFFGYPLVELLAAFGIAQLIGWGWTLLALVAMVPIGLAIIPRRPVAGILIAIPGFLSSALGALLLVPRIGAWAARRSGDWLQQRMTAMGGGAWGRTVVFGTVVPEHSGEGPVRRGGVIEGVVVDRGPDTDQESSSSVTRG